MYGVDKAAGRKEDIIMVFFFFRVSAVAEDEREFRTFFLVIFLFAQFLYFIFLPCLMESFCCLLLLIVCCLDLDIYMYTCEIFSLALHFANLLSLFLYGLIFFFSFL